MTHNSRDRCSPESYPLDLVYQTKEYSIAPHIVSPLEVRTKTSCETQHLPKKGDRSTRRTVL